MIVQIIVFVLFTIVWAIIKIRALLIKQKVKEAVIYGGLMTVSAVVGSLLWAGVEIPSLIVPFNYIFTPLGKMILRL